MTNAAATTATLKFHRRDRTGTLVGTLKNGHGIYRIKMPSNGNEYLVRRRAFAEQAKGYAIAKELTWKEAAESTFSCQETTDEVREWLSRQLARFSGFEADRQAFVDRETEEMETLLSHGVGTEIPQVDTTNGRVYGYRRVDSLQVKVCDGFRRVQVSFRWAEGERYAADGFRSDSKYFKTMDFYADEIAKAEKDSRWLTPRLACF